MKKSELNAMWLMDIDSAIEIYELANQHGKKHDDSCQEEFEEILAKKKDKIKFLGTTDKDIDLLTGDLREKGLKILNLNEIDRRNK